MEPVLKDTILEFTPDLVNIVRKKHNLDQPGRMEEAITILEEWIKKQDHFMKKDFDRFYLETGLITSKGLIERSKSRLDRLCTLRTMLPEFFGDVNPKKDLHACEKIVSGVLPKLDKNYFTRVYIVKNMGSGFTPDVYKQLYQLQIIQAEYMRMHDYVDAFVIVYDFSSINLMDLLTTVDLVEIRKLLTLVMQGYGMSVKGIHIIVKSSIGSTILETLLKLVKNIVLSEKLQDRIHIHTSNETLHEHISKEILPIEFGGNEISIKELSDKWLDVLSSEEHMKHMKEINQAKVNESQRLKTAQFNEEYLGLPGSFRTFNVD